MAAFGGRYRGFRPRRGSGISSYHYDAPPPLTRKDHLDSGTVDEAAMPARYPLLLGCAGFRVQMVGGTASSCVQHQWVSAQEFPGARKVSSLCLHR